MSKQTYTEKEIITHIRRLADGQLPATSDEFQADSQAPSIVTVKSRFGDWNTALEAAGFEPQSRGKSPIRSAKRDVVREVIELSDDGDPVSKSEYQKKSTEWSVRGILTLFDSWDKLVKKAGFDVND